MVGAFPVKSPVFMSQPLTHTLWQSVSRFFSMTLISRLFGLARDLACAQLFGASPLFAAFLVAFQIPNFFRRALAEGAFSQAFIPVLVRYQVTPQARQAFLGSVCLGMALICCVIVGVMVIGAKQVIALYTPGFSRSDLRYQASVQYLQWTAPYLALLAFSAIAQGWLQCLNRFVLVALAPVLLNLTLLLAMWASMYQLSHASPHWLAVAVLIAGVLQCLLVWGQCWRLAGFLPIFSGVSLKHPGFRQVVRYGRNLGNIGWTNWVIH